MSSSLASVSIRILYYRENFMYLPGFKIRPLPDGSYYILSRNMINGQAFFLTTFNTGAVGLRADAATIWTLEWMAVRGSYRIWVQGTNNVLDATSHANENAVTMVYSNVSWQHWGIRIQVSVTHRPYLHRL